MFAAAFALANIAYIWIKKDPQYVQRAAPTARLVQELQHRTPSRFLDELPAEDLEWTARKELDPEVRKERGQASIAHLRNLLNGS